MYSLMINLGDGLVESLALGLGQLQLKSRGLARAVRPLFTNGGQSEKHVLEMGHNFLTAKVPAPQALPPRASLRLDRIGKTVLYPRGT